MARKPKTGSIYLRGKTFWLKYYRNGQCYRESSRSRDFEDAERLLKRRQGEIVNRQVRGSDA